MITKKNYIEVDCSKIPTSLTSLLRNNAHSVGYNRYLLNKEDLYNIEVTGSNVDILRSIQVVSDKNKFIILKL